MLLKPRLIFWIASIALVGGAVAVAAAGSASTAMKEFYSEAVSEKSGVAVTHDIVYGPHRRHRLDLYEPADGAGSGPIVVFLYGGGWRSGQRSIYGFVGSALATRGITTVIPDYRLYPEVKFPAFVGDAALAYGWTWRKFLAGAARKRPIILAGHSAGAHMAALLALDRNHLARAVPEASHPSAFVSLAGPLAFDPTTWVSTREIFSGVSDPDEARPISFARRDAPPSLLVHGARDHVVRLWNTRQTAAALQDAGARVRTVEYPDVGHIGLIGAVSWPLRWRAPVLDEMVAFIRSVEP